MPPTTDIEQEQFDYETAEGFRDLVKREREWHSWTVVGVGLAVLIGLLAMVVGLVALTQSGGGKGTTTVTAAAPKAPAAAVPAQDKPAPTLQTPRA